MAEPYWLVYEDAISFYDISRSSLDRWIRENPGNFVTKYENGYRYVDVNNSKAPEKARLKNVNIPDNMLTLEQTRDYYQISRTTVNMWIRKGLLITEKIANKTYIDKDKSNPLTTRLEPVENWKEIPNYPDYEACKDGRIRSKKTGNMLSASDTHGYCQVMMYKDGKPNGVYAHCLIARTWIPNPENKKTVNHKNHDKKDNRIENLEWATHSEQNSHKNNRKYNRIPHYQQTDYKNEIWKNASVNGYMVSNHGRIKNRADMVLNHNPNTTCKYIEFGVYADEKTKKRGRLYVHREVARAFLDNFQETMVVNHKDGNTHNNHLSNIECCTQSQNVQHAYDNGFTKNRVAIRMIKSNGDIQIFKSLKEAGEKTGFNKDSIGYASKHNTNLGGYKWERI